MADGQEPTITALTASAAPVIDAVSSPAVETPAASPEAAASSSTQTSVPVTENALATESVKTETKTETPTPSVTESILGDESAKADEKKEEKADVKDAKVETPAETKVELPAYDSFKLPENISFDKEPLDAFTKILGEIEVGKLDHKGMQDVGQKLVDLGTKAVTDSINRLNDFYTQFHENQKKEWFDKSMADPELGNGNDKIFRDIAGNLRTAIDKYAGSAEQQKEFRALMKDTGVGNHPALLRMLNNMQKKIDSYTKETSNRSVPAQAPAPSKVKPYQQFYQGN